MTDGFAGVIESLERQRDGIDRALSALYEVGGITQPTKGAGPVLPSTGRKGLKRTPEQRKRMAEAQRKRRQTAIESALAPVATKKQTISDAGRKKLALAMKRRWAVKRAAAQAATKKTVTRLVQKKAAKAAGDEVPF